MHHVPNSENSKDISGNQLTIKLGKRLSESTERKSSISFDPEEFECHS
jgi:hypothetical protein